MLYTTFEVGGESYKLRIDTRRTVELEKRIGGNPLSLFMRMDSTGELPPVAHMVDVLHISLQAYQHKITKEGAYDVFDAWLAEGHTLAEFIPVILDIYKVSGFIGADENEETEKN